MSERHALLTRLLQMAGPNGVAAGCMTTGESWMVRSRTIMRSDILPMEPQPTDVMALRVLDGALHIELRDRTIQVVPRKED